MRRRRARRLRRPTALAAAAARADAAGAHAVVLQRLLAIYAHGPFFEQRRLRRRQLVRVWPRLRGLRQPLRPLPVAATHVAATTIAVVT